MCGGSVSAAQHGAASKELCRDQVGVGGIDCRVLSSVRMATGGTDAVVDKGVGATGLLEFVLDLMLGVRDEVSWAFTRK